MRVCVLYGDDNDDRFVGRGEGGSRVMEVMCTVG